MKTAILLLTMLALCGCQTTRNPQIVALSVAAGTSCWFEMRCTVTEKQDNVTLGTEQLIVRNRDTKSHRVGLPEHYGLLMIPDSAEAIHVSKQEAKDVPAGGEAVFTMPFVFTGVKPRDKQHQYVVVIDDMTYIVGVTRKIY